MIPSLVLPFAAILLLAGCATTRLDYHAPVSMHHAKEHQPHLQAVRHWNELAEDIATQSLWEIGKRELDALPIALVAESASSPFAQALYEFIITKLVNHGVKVTHSAKAPLTLTYQVQVVRFHSVDSHSSSLSLAGTANAFTANKVQVEIIVTTSLLLDGNYLMRRSDIYYVNDSDKRLYSQERYSLIDVLRAYDKERNRHFD